MMPRWLIVVFVLLIALIVVLGNWSKASASEIAKRAAACRAAGGALVFDVERVEVCVARGAP